MKTTRTLAKVKKNAEVAAELAELRAELKVTRGYLVISGRRIGELETQHMRSELRVAVCMLAAASAADPEVELLS